MSLKQKFEVHKLLLCGWTVIDDTGTFICLKKGKRWLYIDKNGKRSTQ